MSAPTLTTYATTFQYKGWMGLSVRCYGGTFEFVAGRGDSRATTYGKSVKECEKRARVLIDKNGRR